MSKAEDRALERFPVHKGASKEWIECHLKDICGDYIEGYHQAEKDLELTWEDISAIRHTMARLRRQFSNDNQVVNNEEFCREVLKRFKAKKGE